MIGILGGTFDPIHHGHLRTALDVLEALKLRQVRFLPLKQAVHRDQPQAGAEQRTAMIRAAIAGQPGFVLDETELLRDGPSYMVDTLHSLRRELPDTPLALLLGADAFNGFLNWREPEAISRLCHLILMGRPGYRLPDSGKLGAFVTDRITENSAELEQSSGGRIYYQPVTQLAVSSTDIRKRAGRGASLSYLLPEPVISIIEFQQLYRK